MSGLTYFTGLALLLLAGAFLLTDHLLTPPPGVTEVNAQRIKAGMSRAWAERILGGPPALEVPVNRYRSHGYWYDGAGLVGVEFDAEGQANLRAVFTPVKQARSVRAEIRLAGWECPSP
jgi:hypothetical protein